MERSCFNQLCGTCEYWSGSRKISFNRENVSFNENERSECIGGGRNRENQEPTRCCSSYTKWAQLR